MAGLAHNSPVSPRPCGEHYGFLDEYLDTGRSRLCYVYCMFVFHSGFNKAIVMPVEMLVSKLG